VRAIARRREVAVEVGVRRRVEEVRRVRRGDAAAVRDEETNIGIVMAERKDTDIRRDGV
jgi:hypothetical protein